MYEECSDRIYRRRVTGKARNLLYSAGVNSDTAESMEKQAFQDIRLVASVKGMSRRNFEILLAAQVGLLSMHGREEKGSSGPHCPSPLVRHRTLNLALLKNSDPAPGLTLARSPEPLPWKPRKQT
jgi:hypothetical protein